MKKLFISILLFAIALTAAAQTGSKPSFIRVTFTPTLDTANLSNGQVFYNSSTNKFRFRQNGSTISLGSGTGGTGITAGDKGDLTVTLGPEVWTIDNNVVTTAKMSTFSSSDLAGKLTDESGTGAFALTNSPAFTTPNLGIPSAAVLTNATGLPGTSVINTPAGNIAATTAQAAINELDLEKALAYPTTGNHTTNYTAALTDANSIIEMESASGLTMTVPPQSSVVWLANTILTVVNYGSADVTLTAGSGVTFRNMIGAVLTIPQYGIAVLKRKASDEWYVFNRGASNNLASGTYTPTLTNTTNISASTAYINNYMRVGSTVTVSGHVDIDPTSTGSTVLGMSLPVASAFGTVDQCGGTAASTGVAGIAIGILADATNDRATFQYIAVDTTNQTFYFTFTYRIL